MTPRCSSRILSPMRTMAQPPMTIMTRSPAREPRRTPINTPTAEAGADHPHGEGGDPDAGPGKRQPRADRQRIQAGGDCRQKEGVRSEEIRWTAGLRAIFFPLNLLLVEPFENHFSADESEQRESEPVVHGADHVLQQRGRGESEERHEDLKAAEKEGGPGGVADLSAGAVAERAAHRDGERVDGNSHRNQKNRNERHGVTSSASP